MMKPLFPSLAALALLLIAPTPTFAQKDDHAAEAQAAPAAPQAAQPPEATRAPHVFGWPFVEWQKMQPRGGSTQGAEVTLASEPRPAWTALQQADLPALERDRRAILALAGSYRVSFDFLETLGFGDDYQPPRPYFSWGTEQIEVLEASERFIRLQHTLVMYFKNEDGSTEGPALMKHWRQDWSYEPSSLWTFRGDGTWEKTEAPSPAGRWSQAVFQVDDSPRYQVLGAWSHDGGTSIWRSDNCPRPLPRREFSVRSDYDILEGVHEIAISPTGWLHTQNNRKFSRGEEGGGRYVGLEIGIDRYESISAPDLAGPVAENWRKTAPYWQQVRKAWDERLASRTHFRLLPEVDGQKLWQAQFEHAATLGEQLNPDHSADARIAREVLDRFLGNGNQAERASADAKP